MAKRGYPNPRVEFVQSPQRPSVRSLAIKWKLSACALHRRCSREKWVEERRDFHQALSKKANEAALARGAETLADEIQQEMSDLKDIRNHLVSRLNPRYWPESARFGMTPDAKDYALLTHAFIGVDKQICLRRGEPGGEDAVGTLKVNIVPLDGRKPDLRNREGIV